MELDLKEAISPLEAESLSTLAHRVNGKTFVEIGSWKGHSASIIGQRAKELDGLLYCVDHWGGNQEEIPTLFNIYETFQYNLQSLGLWDYIQPMFMDSEIASYEFEDESIDFLFIDADHRYRKFTDDLRRWMPKMKHCGIVCGHDCEVRWSIQPPVIQTRLVDNLERDFDGNFHPGVVKGLYDYFLDAYTIIPATRIWFKVV